MNEQIKNMELNDTKNVFLQKMKTDYVPFYVNYLEKMSIISKFPKRLQYILIGLTPSMGVLILSKLGNTPLDFTTGWIFLNLSAR